MMNGVIRSADVNIALNLYVVLGNNNTVTLAIHCQIPFNGNRAAFRLQNINIAGIFQFSITLYSNALFRFSGVQAHTAS